MAHLRDKSAPPHYRNGPWDTMPVILAHNPNAPFTVCTWTLYTIALISIEICTTLCSRTLHAREYVESLLESEYTDIISDISVVLSRCTFLGIRNNAVDKDAWDEGPARRKMFHDARTRRSKRRSKLKIYLKSSSCSVSKKWHNYEKWW